MELAGGGGDHLDGGGGYSGGTGESVSAPYQIVNGSQDVEPSVHAWGATGGSYFTGGRYDSGLSIANAGGKKNYAGSIGGQGGNGFDVFWGDSGGDGGVAGKGGTITVSKDAKIYAFNGNRYTDGAANHDAPNISPTNQCPIYIQNGTMLDVYKNNCWWGVRKNYNYEYFVNLMGEEYVEDVVKTANQATSINDLGNILIRKNYSSADLKTKYINPTTNNSYGVGSGAGYIELSNGTYSVK